MELRTINLGLKAIKFDITLNGQSTDESVAIEERSITAHEQPLPELTNAFGKLPPVFCKILEVEPEWATGLSIFKIVVSRTKNGTRSVKMWAKKQLDTRTDFLHVITTPMVQIDKPQDGESGDVQIEKKHVTLILKALHEAHRYAKGERSQTLLNFDQAKAALQSVADQGADMFANG